MDVSELLKKEALRRGLSPRTIKTYQVCLMKFLLKTSKEVLAVKKTDVHNYIDYLIEKGASGSTINVYLNAIKFFYTQVLQRNLLVNIKYSKTPKRLPEVLTKDEVNLLIESIHNAKHRLLIKLLYSAGLRVSELVNLKIQDLDFSSNIGWVRNGKGNKDRLFIIAQSISEELQEFINNFNLDSHSRTSYIFTGQNQSHLSTRTIQEIIKTARKKSKIGKNIHPHTLRHSFATHLVQNRYDIGTIQNLLGHNSPKTTMIYVHMASPSLLNVRSPLDV